MSDAPDPVAAIVRDGDFGAYAATLFAPAAARPHLLALYAFDIELARVRDLVSDPMVGELRLQWWRDAVENPERADVLAHPVAHALHEAAAYGKLPTDALTGLIDARIDDLYDDPIPSLAALEARLGAAASVRLRLATLIAAAGRDPGGAAVAGFGGVAQGIVRLLRRLPADAARGQLLLPVDRMGAHGAARDDALSGRSTQELAAVRDELLRHARLRLHEARGAFSEMDPEGAPAVLALSLVEPDIAALEKAPLFAPPPPRTHWRTLLRLWRTSRRTPPF